MSSLTFQGIYTAMACFDKPIADRWAVLSGRNPDRRITLEMARSIMNKVAYGDKKLSLGEANALVVLTKHVTWDPKAIKFLSTFLQAALLDKGQIIDLAQPASDTVRKDVLGFLSMPYVGKISFTSPGTGHSYRPANYLTIKELISTRDISLWQVNKGISDWFPKQHGVYGPQDNKLIVYYGLTPEEMAAAVVHEATHAIQDYRDKNTKVEFNEADGFIAGATTDRMVAIINGKNADEQQVLEESPIHRRAFELSKLVFDGIAVLGNKEWVRGYNELVALVAQNTTYKKQAKKTQMYGEDPPEGEAARFAELLKQLPPTP